MKIWHWLYYDLYSRYFPNSIYLLSKEIQDCHSVVDLGCGSSSPIKYLKFKNISYLGVDRFWPSLKTSKDQRIHNQYIRMDLLKIDFPHNSFDCAMALDVIEHFSKEEGLKLIKSMEKCASKKIIIFTPNGFIPQVAFDGNAFQEHKSGYTYHEMTTQGFRVYGINGHKIFRGDHAKIKFRPRWIWFILSEISQLFTFLFPRYAYQIFCVKDLNKSVVPQKSAVFSIKE